MTINPSHITTQIYKPLGCVTIGPHFGPLNTILTDHPTWARLLLVPRPYPLCRGPFHVPLVAGPLSRPYALPRVITGIAQQVPEGLMSVT